MGLLFTQLPGFLNQVINHSLVLYPDDSFPSLHLSHFPTLPTVHPRSTCPPFTSVKKRVSQEYLPNMLCQVPRQLYTNPYIKAGQRNPVGAKFSSVALSMSPLAAMSKFSCFQDIRGLHPHCHGHLNFVAHMRCSTHSPKCGSWWVAGTVLLFPILITSRPALPYAPGSKWEIGTSPLPTPLYSRWGARPYLSCSCCWHSLREGQLYSAAQVRISTCFLECCSW